MSQNKLFKTAVMRHCSRQWFGGMSSENFGLRQRSWNGVMKEKKPMVAGKQVWVENSAADDA